MSAERSQYPNRSPDFSSMLPIPTPSVTVNSPPPLLWWGRFDLFARIGAWKRSLDHVEFVLAELAPYCHPCFRDCAEEGRISATERGKKQRLVESDAIRHGVRNGWGRLPMGFGNAIEGERSAQRLVELVWWVSAVASATIEDNHGGSSSARGRSRWEILKTMCWTQKVLIPNLVP